MTTASAAALVVVYQTLTHPLLLLVKSNRGWGLPQAECSDALRTRLLQTLFPRNATFQDMPAAVKTFNQGDQPVSYQLTFSNTDALNPYVDCPEWTDARWASYEEAFHIGQVSQEEALQWAERTLKKHLTV